MFSAGIRVFCVPSMGYTLAMPPVKGESHAPCSATAVPSPPGGSWGLGAAARDRGMQIQVPGPIALAAEGPLWQDWGWGWGAVVGK